VRIVALKGAGERLYKRSMTGPGGSPPD